MMKQFTLRLRADIASDDARTREVLERAVRTAARHLLVQARLIATGKEPDVAVFSDDMISGSEAIELTDNEEDYNEIE